MNFKEHTKINVCGNISVVDIGAKVGGGGRPPCFKIGIEHPVFQLCIKIGYRIYNVLRYGIPMVRFHGLCDGKRMVGKQFFFGFCVEVSSFFFRKYFGDRYLIVKYHWLIL